MTVLPPLTGPASLLTFPPGEQANLSQVQLHDANLELGEPASSSAKQGCVCNDASR